MSPRGHCHPTIATPLFKVFSDEAHMSGSEIDDGTDKATAWKKKTRYSYSEIERSSRKTKGKHRTSQGTSDV